MSRENDDAIPAVPSVDSIQSQGSTELLNATQCSDIQYYGKKILWGGVICYALFITSIFCMFSEKRAEGSPGYSALFISSSFIFNIFGALLFPKRALRAFKDLKNLHGDPGYCATVVAAFALSVLTVMASIAISKSSVKDWPEEAQWVAAIAFGTNTFVTRFVGSLDSINRIRNAIEFREFFALCAEFERKKGVIKNTVGGADISTEQLLKAMVETPEATKQWLLGWAFWAAKVGLALASVVLTPMWIAMSQQGLEKVHPGLGEYTALTTIAGIANEFFYGLNCFDLFSTVKEFHDNMLFQHAALSQRLMLKAVFAGFSVLAYYSGGGFGASLAGMEKNGFGSVVETGLAGLLLPQFVAIMEQSGIYSNLAQVFAGSVNFAATSRFFINVLKEKAASRLNFPLATLSFLGCYEKKKSGSSEAAAGYVAVPVTLTPFELAEKQLNDILQAVRAGQFGKREEEVNGLKRVATARNLAQLSEGEPIDIKQLVSTWKKIREDQKPVERPASEATQLLN